MINEKKADELIKRLTDRLEALRASGIKGVRVGSFGVPYAEFHEFGTDWSEKMAWFILRMGKQNGAASKRKRDKSKGVIEFDYTGDVLRARIKKRPFLFKALEQNQEKVRAIMAKMSGEKPIGIDVAMIRIGTLLEAQIVRNIRDRREGGSARGPMVGRTGALLNSIRYELIK
jgi:hypothetical protein